VLGLKLATDPRWVNIAEKTIDEILTDHAYCEQKATSNCISMVVRYPEFEDMVEEVTAVAAEEWGHFRKVLKELKKRGFKLGPNRNDNYVVKLRAFKIKGDTRLKTFIDELLIAAMIEARSCERFRLLSLHINDDGLKKFYHEFMVSEAGHYTLFLDLAKKYIEPEYVKTRWQQFLEFEAELIQTMEYRGDRMH
jgi:tRNA-(ms[2]io[6]A)-hydroxylase